jgi:hypothetical protein
MRVLGERSLTFIFIRVFASGLLIALVMKAVDYSETSVNF